MTPSKGETEDDQFHEIIEVVSKEIDEEELKILKEQDIYLSPEK